MIYRLILWVLTLSFVFSACTKSSSDNSNHTGGGTGQGGSLARYTIVGKYLYTVDGSSLRIFDLDASGGPQLVNQQNIGFNIETLFPFNNYLFIGSNSAMYIYSLNNPAQPQQLSESVHFTGCDPVVANDTMAYLTIHGGTICRSNINELQVYDIKDLQNPIWKKSISMTHPLGLGLNNQYLYVCDQEKGLYVYDVQQGANPILLNTLQGEVFLDVIPDIASKTLIAMLKDGIALYDMNDPVQLPKLSVIK